ncbi:MAG: hypothetical protein P9L92_02410 [Candidatus Electryonea clarkiae]|nr:hypothetical protein [Candidatus Electryonea clarkiae]MDP8288425.1 hypothetical protein [Candidatus Electryonea clarkiae]
MRLWFRRLFCVAVIIFYFFFIRRWMNTRGAEDSEVDEDLSGDWILGDKLRATMAINLLRSVDEAWPWIAQMGRGAGYYACDYIINGNRTSADYVLKDLPPPTVGDRNRILGKIEEVEEKSSVTWIREGRNHPFGSLDHRLTYHLKPRGLGACRLLIRSTLDYRGPCGPVLAMIFEPIKFLFITKQISRIKQLTESYEARNDEQKINRYLAGNHQGDKAHFSRKG